MPLSFLPVKRQPGAVADARVAVEKCGCSSRERGEHVAAFGLFLDQHPAGVRPRRLERGEPDVAVAFVQEIADREAAGATPPACSGRAIPCSP